MGVLVVRRRESIDGVDGINQMHLMVLRRKRFLSTGLGRFGRQARQARKARFRFRDPGRRLGCADIRNERQPPATDHSSRNPYLSHQK
jgi:hypothetical protein